MAIKTITGRVIKLGDYVNTDVISPARWMREGLDVLRLHTMEAIRPDFYRDVNPGDIIVGGKNFGCGSHREPATAIMQTLGISAIIAESMARLYFRNGIAFGIPVFSAQGISEIVEEGQTLEIVMDTDEVTIKNLETNKQLTAAPIPKTMADVLEAGGVYKLLKQKKIQKS